MTALTKLQLDDAELDELAYRVADAIGHDDAAAWEITRALEEAAGIFDCSPQPPAAVIGRRFARAHRHLAARRR